MCTLSPYRSTPLPGAVPDLRGDPTSGARRVPEEGREPPCEAARRVGPGGFREEGRQGLSAGRDGTWPRCRPVGRRSEPGGFGVVAPLGAQGVADLAQG